MKKDSPRERIKVRAVRRLLSTSLRRSSLGWTARVTRVCDVTLGASALKSLAPVCSRRWTRSAELGIFVADVRRVKREFRGARVCDFVLHRIRMWVTCTMNSVYLKYL